MFIIRQAVIDDAPTLLKLAKMVHFINLPADPDIINSKIMKSRRSFAGKAESERERQFMFVLEDTESGNVIGTSAVICCNSWPGHPFTFLKVRKRQLYSQDLQTGAVHVTLKFGTDTSGPSEIGGLILSPAYRGHKEKLGSLLSFIRFHFISLNRKWFSQRIISEMMGALTPDSHNLLWEYLGRRFINLSYAEADRFCQHSKEFITSLFPKVEIYASLLPAEARNLIGKVNDETRPAIAMLKKLGFKDKGQIDPFDGGPYLEAQVDDIPIVRATKTGTLGETVEDGPLTGLVSASSSSVGFRAVRCRFSESGGRVSVPAKILEGLGAEIGDPVGFTPLPAAETAASDEDSSRSSADTPRRTRPKREQVAG